MGDFVKIYSSNDLVKIQRIRGLLEENDIRLFHHPSVTSGIFGINYNLDIVVNHHDRQKATELIQKEGIDISDFMPREARENKTPLEKTLLFFLILFILAMVYVLLL